jgi:hypothetical protein
LSLCWGYELTTVNRFAGEGLSPAVLARTLKRVGHTENYDLRIRSSFKTWATERTAYPSEIVEMCLAHVVGNDVERA